MSQETAFFDKHRTGELINRLSADTSLVSQSVTMNISDGLRSSIMVVAGVSMMVRNFYLLRLILDKSRRNSNFSKITLTSQSFSYGRSTISQRLLRFFLIFCYRFPLTLFTVIMWYCLYFLQNFFKFCQNVSLIFWKLIIKFLIIPHNLF